MTTGRYVLFLASFLILKTEAIEDERLSSSSRLFQGRDLSAECSDITSLLTKLISDLEGMKGQISEQLTKQAEETKTIANDLHAVKNDLHTLKGVEKKQVDDPEEIKMTMKKFNSNDNSASHYKQYLMKIQTSVDNITDRTLQISNILQLHDERLQKFIHKDIVSPKVNLALGRPATQSSTYEDLYNGVCDARRAVDGNYHNDNTKTPLRCSITKDGPGGPNWWRVQLDRPYRLQKVIVTNRKDCCGDRLDYFIVGVTNSTADPVRGAYPLCGQYSSKAGLGAAMTLLCEPNTSAGQYVIIQQPLHGPGWFTLCEVEVYARPDID